MRRLLKKLLKALAIVAATGVLTVGLFFASLWFEASKTPTSPLPAQRILSSLLEQPGPR